LPVGSRVKAITFFFESGAGSNFIGDLWREQFPGTVVARLLGRKS